MMRMSAEQLVIQLNKAGIQLVLEANQLKLQAKSASAVTNELRQLIRDHKRTLITYLKGDDNQPVINRRAGNTPPPLSFAQQRLWFLDQLEPNSALYNIPLLLRLEGELDVATFEQSLAYLVIRHESLRTTFETVAGEPVQVIHPPTSLSLIVVEVVSEASIQDIAAQEAVTPFNLCSGPLWRVNLLRLNEHDHRLLLTLHHIISDGWSLGVLAAELSQVYRAYHQGAEPTLPPLPIQYADFAVWQRAHLSGERLHEHLAYWRKQLAAIPALLELPTDRPRPPVQSYRGAHYAFHLNAALTANLKHLAQQHGATLFTVLLAAFDVLLARYSRQDDIVVGAPIAHRTRAEAEGLIGFFVNTLVLRTHLEDNPSFTELLAQVRRTTLEAYAHQDLPFEQLIEVMGVERSLSYSSLFQVMLVLQNAEMGQFDLPNLTATMQPTAFPFAKFDLTLDLRETDAGLAGVFEYSSDLFDETTIARLAGHFEVLLNSIVETPARPVLHLPMLTSGEVQQIVHDWNDTTVDFGAPQTIHTLFEQQVARTPDAVAVVFEDQQLTYAELNAHANQLAHYLIELGVGPDKLVGICVERSLEMLVGLLGILKAGGAYVPLDPSYPQERLTFMLQDAAISVLLIQEHLRERLPLILRPERNEIGTPQGRTVISLDSDWSQISGYHHDNPAEQVQAHNLAYVIYTSGSTGQPKGVSILHNNLFHSTTARLCYYREPVAAFLLIPSFAFDSSVAVIYWTLCSGGKLIIPSQAGFYNLLLMANLITTHHISHWLSVPSYYEQLLKINDYEALKSLHTVIVAGESCPQALVTNHYRSLPRASLFNEYGPTECTVWSTVYKFPEPHKNSTISLGRPIRNVHMYILDPYLQPVPVGVSGEVYIGGNGLARGYLNRPDLTTDKFITNPFGRAENSDRLYRTGDLARWLLDGNMEFLGRIDHQVKIRGFRVELGEIESILLAEEGVREAVVLAREDNSGDKRLVAYLVGEMDMKRLRQQLAQRLPEYMVPATFVQLDALPLTPNGKLDRRALPAPSRQLVEANEIILPQTETERSIAAVWREILQLDKVGIHDNFFDLGGHSLAAMQAHHKLQSLFAGEITLMDLFRYPTIQTLAEYVKQQQKQQAAEVRQTQGEVRSARRAGIQQRRTLRQQIDQKNQIR